MLLKSVVVAVALVIAAPAVAQPPQGPTPEQMANMPPEARAIAEAGTALGTCIEAQLSAAPATADADAAAAAAVAGCGTQKTALETAVEALIASPIVPDAQKPQARARFQGEMAALNQTVATQLRAARAGTTPPAQPRP